MAATRKVPAASAVLPLLLVLLHLVYSLPNGAHPRACATLTPRPPHAPGMNTPNPYSLTIAGITAVNGSYYYTPGRTYNVTLRGNSGEQFRGFLVQIRSAADQSILTGLNATSVNIKPHLCTPATGGVTHTNNRDKTSIQFQWTPTAGTGDVVFRYTVVQVRDIHWDAASSPVIQEQSSPTPSLPPPTPSPNCTRPCPTPVCPNPIPARPGQCCPTCNTDCRLVDCLDAVCEDAFVPPGECCQVCPNCSNVTCPSVDCPNPVPPGPGQCCPRCFEVCAATLCLRPSCANATFPPGRCCAVCPLDSRCRLPRVVGPCKAAISRWFFNSTSNKCEQFIYGGCQGNANNFMRLGQCLNRCAPDVIRCPPDQPVPICTSLPCSAPNCTNHPTATCVNYLCGGCNARFFDSGGNEVTESCREQEVCPIEGQIRGCESPCPANCDNRFPSFCPEFCRLGGCVCPPGTVIDYRQNECVARSNCTAPPNVSSCSVEGQILGCESICPATCDAPIRLCIEPAICRFGCTCPSNTVIDPRQNRCVALANCTCPQGKVKGCRSLCPPTCANPNPTCIQPLVCTPACVCPSGTVLDSSQNRCVPFANCTCPQGKVKGCRSLCPATCDNPNPTCIQPLVCTPECVCPSGTVFDSRQNRCVPFANCTCPQGKVKGCRSLCPATCDNPNPTCIEPLVCTSACVCPSGTVLDSRKNRCVTLQQCSCPSSFVKGCQSQCPPTCDNPNRTCIEPLICRPACVCPSGTVYDSRRSRCVAPLRCTRVCPPTRPRVYCFINPCFFSSCRNHPNATCVADYCGSCKARFYDSNAREVKCSSCPIKGQVYIKCAPACAPTCENPRPFCRAACRPGCTCPSNSVLDRQQKRCVKLQHCSNTTRLCSVKGQVFQQCGTCPLTCRSPPNSFCTLECRPGCGCPAGQVVDEDKNQCVTRENCTNICELPRVVGPCRGRISRHFFNSSSGQCERFFYGGCRGNSNNFQTANACREKCGDICELPRVVGPCRARIRRHFFNSTSGRCEEFYYGGCRGNKNNFQTATACQGRCGGASCPPNQTLTTCLRDPCRGSTCRGHPSAVCWADYCDGCHARWYDASETEVTSTCSCPPPCSHSYCGSNPHAMCSLYSYQVPSCTGRCGLSNCGACYYSRRPLYQPDFYGFCRSCSSSLSTSRLQRCLRNWAGCISRMAYFFYGQARRRDRIDRNFRCWSHPCFLRG